MQASLRHPEVRAEGAPRRMHAPRLCRRRPSRAAEPVIGPAKGRTRWPPPQGDGKRAVFAQAKSFSRRLFAPELCQPRHVKREDREALRETKGWGPGFSMPYAVFANSNSNKLKWEVGRRQTLVVPAAPSGAALPCGAARLSASHHGSYQRESSSLRLSFRPGFLGRGLARDRKIMCKQNIRLRALPAIACPSPGKHLPPRS
jgi:hypothetical protein